MLYIVSLVTILIRLFDVGLGSPFLYHLYIFVCKDFLSLGFNYDKILRTNFQLTQRLLFSPSFNPSIKGINTSDHFGSYLLLMYSYSELVLYTCTIYHH